MAWLGSSQMGEAELLAAPPSVLMDCESHLQRAAAGPGLHASGFCCLPIQSTLSARYPSCIHPFIHSVIYPTGTPQCLLGAERAGH